jgi:nicotinamide mononucleotide transporter
LIPWLEISANAANAASILLARQNNVHTWWTGIVGCLLFATVFSMSKLYADTLLQVFFIVTSCLGWWNWRTRVDGNTLPVTKIASRPFLVAMIAALLVATGYGYLLWRFTDAYAPFIDSLVLTMSVAAQFMLMARKYETWHLWLLVNTISVALFASRGLWITALLYAAFWVNAVTAMIHWRRLIKA